MASANRYTTTQLVQDIRRIGHIPTSQTLYQTDDLLSIADMEMEVSIMRQILSVREGYYLTYEEFEINQESTYAIPERAVGSSLIKVQLYNGTSIYPISRTEVGEQFSTVTSPTGSFSFWLQNNKIVVLPNPVSGVIRMWYLRKPNSLVQTSACAQVQSIDVNTGIVTCTDTLPSTFSTSSLVDIIQDRPHFDWVGLDLLPVSVSGADIEFSELPTDLREGDWIALAGQTPVPQMPIEFWPILVQRVVVKYYESQGYIDKMKVAQKKLEEIEKNVYDIINPRVSQEAKRIISNDAIIGGFSRWTAWTAK